MKKINLLAKLGGFAFLAATPLVAAKCGGESWDTEISIL
ncbi:variable surface lipoprotein [Mycoplasmopsis agalactiae]|nr:variable surface lipoprotein [Mycoplasmopsis agalactiae]